MAARVCPYCRELNSVSERRCFRCGRRLPGPLWDGILTFTRQLLGVEAPMTRLLLGLELLVFALCVLFDRRLPLGLGDGFSGATLIRFGALGTLGMVDLGHAEPWRLLSAVFVHVGLLHVGMNLFVFTDLGRQLEHELGSGRFALLFLGSGVLGFWASELWYAPYSPLTAGASGGVFGEIGAVVGILAARRDPEWRRALARYVIYALLLGIALNVNTAAHLGGFAAGIALGFGLAKERMRLRLERTMAVAAAVAVLASVASVALSAASPAWQEQRVRELLSE